MKLREVGAKNFRTLEDLSVEFIDDYCTLSGRNNAGKTAIVTIIRHFLDDEDRPNIFAETALSFSRDHTQWSTTDEMQITVRLELDRHDDAEVFFVVDKYASMPIEGDQARVRVTETFLPSGESRLVCRVNGSDLDTQNSSEIAKKLKTAENLVVHNSTAPNRNFYFFSGEMTEVLESHFSQEDRKKISDAERNLSNKVKNAAKQHFADNLGVLSDEFIPWRKIVGSANSKVVLVEGSIDVEYFEILKSKHPDIYTLPDDVEVFGYGGKDALKNTQVLQFMLSRLDRVFITFDLDAKTEVCPKLASIGLAEETDYCSIGVNKPGRECIEGLLPEAILAEVYAENVDDVMALGSANGNAKKSAKSRLKKAALEKFKSCSLSSAEIPEMGKMLKKISKAF